MFGFMGKKKKLTDTADTSALEQKNPDEEQADSQLRYAFDSIDRAMEPIQSARRKAENLRTHAASMRPTRSTQAGVKK